MHGIAGIDRISRWDMAVLACCRVSMPSVEILGVSKRCMRIAASKNSGRKALKASAVLTLRFYYLLSKVHSMQRCC
jgi:hypothetical protein